MKSKPMDTCYPPYKVVRTLDNLGSTILMTTFNPRRALAKIASAEKDFLKLGYLGTLQLEIRHCDHYWWKEWGTLLQRLIVTTTGAPPERHLKIVMRMVTYKTYLKLKKNNHWEGTTIKEDDFEG